MIYDIIGDVHGQADKLIGLLNKLGYQHDGKSYVAPNGHQAIFIGDLIDRGKKQLTTLNIAFDMLDNQQAQIIMGNHEYNALAYATKSDTDHTHYLRPHTANNTKQHQAFLDEVIFDSDTHHHWLNRFWQLPLWLELDDAIFVHACYDPSAIALLKKISPNHLLTPEILQNASKKNTAEFIAIERILKGIEAPLPDGVIFYDKTGIKRKHARVKWWMNDWQHQSIQDILFAKNLPNLPLSNLPDDLTYFHIDTQKPIFIGHYWLSGKPAILSEQVACVDYSAGIDGYLTAYRFDSHHQHLDSCHFIQYCD
ncbi:MAG: metallophosphoesterase [Moraxella sp.]